MELNARAARQCDDGHPWEGEVNRDIVNTDCRHQNWCNRWENTATMQPFVIHIKCLFYLCCYWQVNEVPT